MSTLRHKLDTIRRRLPAADICPGHVTPPTAADLRASLRAFSPFPEDRAAYRAEQDALAATPPCERCGWRPEPIYIQTADHWGQYGPDDEDGAA